MTHGKDDDRDATRYRFLRNKMALTRIICDVVTDFMNGRIRDASADTNKVMASLGDVFDSEVDKMMATAAEAKGGDPWRAR